jgi:hypothetical protein
MIGLLLASTDLGWSRTTVTAVAKKAPVIVTGAPAKTTGSTGGGTGSSNSMAVQFSGQATLIDITNIHMGPPFVIIGDTGELPSAGGNIEVSITETNMEGLSLALGSAATRGMDDTAISTVTLNSLSITIETTNMVRHTITADSIVLDASATCVNGSVTFDAHSSIQGLSVDGVAIPVTGGPNQLVDLDDFSLVINEQVLTSSGNYGAILLAALHIIDPGCLEGLIGVVRADVRCTTVQPPPPPSPGTNDCGDFITGGGWIVGSSGGRANFAVAGGVRNGAFWGHLNFIDHDSRLHVKSTAVTGYQVVTDLTRDISFNVLIGGVAGTAIVRVTDNGEPGRNDTFGIALSTGYTAGSSLGGDHPGGGNIQLHKLKCSGHQGGNDDHHGKPCDTDRGDRGDKGGKPCDKDNGNHGDKAGKPCDKDNGDHRDKGGKPCDKDKGDHGDKAAKPCDKDNKSDNKEKPGDKGKTCTPAPAKVTPVKGKTPTPAPAKAKGK